MDKRKEINFKRDKILNLVKAWAVIPHPYESPDAKGLLHLLDLEGVVIQVDRELPSVNIITDSFPVPCNEICHHIEQESMLKANFVAVERLME